MEQKVESVLYTDPQNVVPAGRCPVCGGALYPPGLYCLRCDREQK